MDRRAETELFLLSAVTLYSELLLIRWAGTEIGIFAYLQNTILVVCFLGLGVGSLTSRSPLRLERGLGAFLLLALGITAKPTREILERIATHLGVFDSHLGWIQSRVSFTETVVAAVQGISLIAALLLLVLFAFVPFGRWLGRLLDGHPRPIRAYSLNIAGSLAGIGLFTGMSWLETPPALWLAILSAAGLALLSLAGRGSRRTVFLLVALAGVGAASIWLPSEDVVLWSPYQKVTLEKVPRDARTFDRYRLGVNDATYMRLIDLSQSSVTASWNPEPEMRGLSQYDLPYRLHPEASSVLVLGAGAGNDAAAAVRAGVKRIVAVEIDPVIAEAGRRFHPESPYTSTDVELVVDDARAVLDRAGQRFDLVVFGLLDSHTAAGLSNMRLDSYVYTRESVEAAVTMLEEGGLLVLSFEIHRRPFIASRIARMVREVTGADPLVLGMPAGLYGPGGVLFVGGDVETALRGLASDPRLEALWDRWSHERPVPLEAGVAITTDDWPYLYLDRPRVPNLFLLIGCLIVLLVLVVVLRMGAMTDPRRWARSEWHFFWLGLGFLLLEVVNVSRAGLVLGNTWIVNAVIIGALLVMILLANWVVAAFPEPPWRPIGLSGVIASCLALYIFDLRMLVSLPFGSKILAVGLLTTVPVFFSGLVFVRSFAACSRKDLALGTNLLGALLGGVLQWATFLTGTRFLLLIVALAYVGAWASLIRVRAWNVEAAAIRTPPKDTPPFS